MKEKEKWYQSTWFTILMLLFVFPVGLFLMWKFKKNWKLWVKILITVLVAISVVNMMTNKTPTDNNTSKTKTEQKSDKQEAKKDDKKTFETDGSATITANQAVSPDDLGFIGDKINPESTKNAKLVFDVAPSIAEKDNLVLQVQSGFWGTETAKIELK
ncbi:hypothetical protein [Staphylococcus simulans]|uniref:hypothetical protein n=1 Tax=Staphylococcus simulans TaxID=1286 RepID=UPI003CF3A03F